MKLYRTDNGNVVEHEGSYYRVPESSWDALITHDDLYGYLLSVPCDGQRIGGFSGAGLQAPIGTQEVWAAGVTYYRSRDARMAEAKDAGGGDFYDRVYSAERPELFFKATASRVAAPGSHVRIRSDASWSVPEPELTLVINPRGKIIGHTIGNDMSSRDIEGENLLYLPQAKIYERSCALGPWMRLGASETEARQWKIKIQIKRNGECVFAGETSVGQIKRNFESLAAYLFRSQKLSHGAVLLTGTGVVPPDTFTLREKDSIEIEIPEIGLLKNSVVVV